MGDAQSAQREDKEDAVAEEESGKVDDALTEQNTEDKILKNNGQISEIKGKAEASIADINGHCEDEIAADAVLSPEEDGSETEKPLENVEIKGKESPCEAGEDIDLEMSEMEAEQNDINKGFRRFFSNIGLKLTVKKDTSDIATDVPTNKEEQNIPEDVENTAKETKSENVEENIDVNIAKEASDNDSTTCPTMTDVTSEEVQENAEDKTAENKDELDNADAATTSAAGADLCQDATPEKDSTSPSSPEEEAIESPIKRFFSTGIFSGLRKKKRDADDETTEKELVDMGKKVTEKIDETTQDQQQDKDEISPKVESTAVYAKNKDEVQSASSAQTTDDRKSTSRDPSTIVTESEILSSQEKDKVQSSPLKKLFSGSSARKVPKKQRSRRSSDATVSDSGEHDTDKLPACPQSVENQKEEDQAAQPSAEAAVEQESAWASFKKLLTPKKRMKRPSLSNEETQIPGLVEEPKPSEGEQISDHSTEEGKKRKDSSVSWEAVLCGSGRRRSRKTSDSEEDTPQIDTNKHKHRDAESPLESSNDISPKQAGSPSEADEGTWKSLKRLVTPKRKAKDEDDSKDNMQSDSEGTQDESSFSIKKLLPGRKKRKSNERPDQMSSDEADRDVASGDEDSDTPAVVPLSEFDIVETEVHIQTQAEIEHHVPEEANNELQQDLLDQMAETVPPSEALQTEANKVQGKEDVLEKQASTTQAAHEEPDDLTESPSKHQVLSDIPEEGNITDTMATPASVADEAFRDDTIAEDLIEITSEAITAPEPATDIALADETEMISAVSHLYSESSKTSGNTTPVPAEYDVIETDKLLHEVVETISISPKEVPLCSDELGPKKVVGSVSHQIFETFTKEKPNVLEIHGKFDATAFKTGLNVEDLDAINELAANALRESILEVTVSTEVVSEVATEKFDTAEMSLDEIQVVNVTYPEESIKELERINETNQELECLSDINAAVSTDNEILPDASSLVEGHHEPPQRESEETDSVALLADESKDGAVEQEVQAVPAIEDQMLNITDQIQAEDKDQPPTEVEKLQELTQDQIGGDSVQSLEQEISEDRSTAESVTHELEEEILPPTETNTEPEMKEEPARMEHVQVPDESEAVKASTLESEAIGQSPEEEVKSKDIQLTDESKQTAEHLSEVSDQPKDKELPGNAVTTEHIQEQEELEAVQAEDVNVRSHENELITEAVTGEPNKETKIFTKVNLEQVDASKTVHVQEPVLETVQVPTSDSECGVQLLDQEVISEDIPKAETVMYEPKDDTILLTEVKLEPVDASKSEHVQDPEVLEIVKAPTSASEAGSLLLLKKELTSEDIQAMKAATDTSKEDNILMVEPEEKVSEEDIKTESDVQDIVPQTEEEALMDVNVERLDAVCAQEDEKQILLEDIPKTDSYNTMASVNDETSEDVAHLGQALQITEDQKGGNIPQNAQIEQIDCIPEVVANSQTLTAVHLSPINEEPSTVQVLKTVFSEQISAPCTENAANTGELNHEVHLNAVQASIEQEKVSELAGPAIKTALIEHAIVPQVVVCNLTDVSVAIPEVMTEKTIEVTEPLMDTMANQQMFKKEMEAATPFVQHDVPETAEEGSVVVVMHTPSVHFEDNHRIQVQVVDVDIKSAGTIVDSVLEVGVTEDKEVIDACHETFENVDKLSATPEIEEAIITEETKVEVTQHVKEQLPESPPESEAVTPDIPESLDGSYYDCKENLAENKYKHEESEEGITAEEVKSLPVELEIRKTNEQPQIAQSPIVTPTNTSLVVPQNAGTISIGNVESPSSLSLEFKLNIQFGHPKSPASPPPTTEIIAPVKQTDVSEVRVQAMETEIPLKPTNTTQGTKTQKRTQLTEVADQATENLDSTENVMIMRKPVLLDVGIQAMETVQPVEEIKSTDRVTSCVQGTKTTEPVRRTGKREVFLSQPVLSKACDQETKAEAAMITTQPLLQDVGFHVMETVQPVEEIKSTDRVTSSVQVTETTEPVSPTRKKEVFLSQPVLSKACDQETKAEAVMITTQPPLLDVGIQAMETVQPVEEIKSTDRVTSCVQGTKTTEPVSPTGKREVFLSQPVLAKACDQETKAEAAMITNQPPLLAVGIQVMETVQPVEEMKSVDRVTSSVQVTETTEPVSPTGKREVFLSQPVLSKACHQETKAEAAMITTQPRLLDVGIQAMETVQPVEEIKSTDRVTSCVQGTKTTEPVSPTGKREVFLSQPVLAKACDQETKAEAAMITNQPPLLAVGIQVMETVQPVEEIKSTDRVTSSVQVTETTEPVSPTGKREVFLSQPVLSKACHQETKAEAAMITTQPRLLDVGIQAMETVQPVEEIKSADRVTSSVQGTKTTEPVSPTGKREAFLCQPVLSKACDQETKAEAAMITTQPPLLAVGIQVMETVQPVEEIKSTDRVTSCMQGTKTTEPVSPTGKREVFLCQPVLSEACDQETKAEAAPVKQTEEENEQDVWMDAEEGIYTQEEVELQAPQTASGQEKKAEVEAETAPDFKTEEEENEQEMHKACEIEEDEDEDDFAVALEDPELANASLTVEWD